MSSTAENAHSDGLPSGALGALELRVASLSPVKRALLKTRAVPPVVARDLRPAIVTREGPGVSVMSYAQQRLWILEQIDPGTPAYNVRSALRVRGELAIPALAAALNELAARHASLRTTFCLIDGEPLQIVAPNGGIPLDLVDLCAVPPAEREDHLAATVRTISNRTFDLARGPLIRATLVATDRDDHVLVIVRHHLISDAWSNGIFNRELAILYRALRAGTPHALPQPETSYADFATWQRGWLQGDVLEGQLAYWRQRLEGAPPVLDVPGDRPRPLTQTYSGSVESRAFPPRLATELRAFARTHRASDFMVMLAVFNVLLARYTASDDIVVGTPIANRGSAEFENVIGFFINTLPLRTRIDVGQSFTAVLAAVRETALGAFEHSDVPFEKLVDDIKVERRLGHAPIVNVMFVMQQDGGDQLALDDLTVSAYPFERTTAKFDLSLHVAESAGGIDCAFEYNTDLFDRDTVRRMLAHLETLLEGLIAEPGRPVGHAPLLAPDERRRIVTEWNDTAADVPGEPGVPSVVERAARRWPTAVALRHNGETLTYAELNARANRVARRLRGLGAAAGTRVGIAIEPSLEMIVGVLAVLKSGAAYVPIEINSARERAHHIAQRVSLILTQRHRLASLPAGTPSACIDDPTVDAGESPDDLLERAANDDIAYVLHTSGSTGAPKGVAMPHGALTNLVDWQRRRSNDIAQPRTLQFASLGFDVSFQEIFSTLAAGGTLVLVSDATRRDVGAVLDVVIAERIERLFLPFVVLQSFVDVAVATGKFPRDLRLVVTAGEQLKITPAIRAFFEALPDCRLDNQYGPTEAHVVSAHMLAGAPTTWPHLPPIGRPIQNDALYVLDRWLEPLPIGVPGELYIGGAGLAHGYLDRPDLTAERFIPSPFGLHGERLYRTGDSARLRADGTIEFLGRIDRQVKIRGFRIEPAEIEAVLLRDPSVADAIVVPVAGRSGDDKRLAAYVKPAGTAEVDLPRIRASLRDALPDYMLPTTIVSVPAFPVNRNGKLDIAALPAAGEPLAAAPPPVDNPLHAQLMEIWENVLGIAAVGIDDNFFDLGGHSLLAVVLMARIEEAFGRRVPVATLFREPTIAGLARALRVDAHRDAHDRLITVRAAGTQTPFFFMHGDLSGGGYYCRAFARHLDPERPLYIFTPHGADGEGLPPSIEAMAEENIAILKAARPAGPYALGGFCSGGLVAYEMARRLVAAGDVVERVVLIDTGGRNARLGAVAGVLASTARLLRVPSDALVALIGFIATRARAAEELASRSTAARWAFVRSKAVALLRRGRHADDARPSTARRAPEGTALIDAWLDVGARYVPQRYAGSVELVWPAFRDPDQPEMTAQWQLVASALTDVRVPGDHLSCITRHVADLAPRVDAYLNGAVCSP